MSFWEAHESLSVVQWLVRAGILYFYLLILTKLMGQREIGRLTLFDFIIGITTGSVVASTLSSSNTSLQGAIWDWYRNFYQSAEVFVREGLGVDYIVLGLAVIVVFVLVVLISTAIKVEHEKGGEEVIKSVYLYLVLFATLMMSIGGSVGVFMAAADIISPNAHYQSFDEYRFSGAREKINAELNVTGQENTKLSDEELLERYNAMVSAEKERQIIRGKNNLIKSLGWIIIPLPVFLYFQGQLAKREA